jgi:hypothetical protein
LRDDRFDIGNRAHGLSFEFIILFHSLFYLSISGPLSRRVPTSFCQAVLTACLA